jgi:hypothetical protein
MKKEQKICLGLVCGVMMLSSSAAGAQTLDGQSREEVESAVLSSRDHQITASYDYLRREGGSQDFYARNFTTSYSEKISDRVTGFTFVSMNTSDLKPQAVGSDATQASGVSGGLGATYYAGRGLSFAGAVFGGKNGADTPAQAFTTRTHSTTLGASVTVSQFIPVSTQGALLGMLSASIVNSRLQEEQVLTKTDDNHNISPHITYIHAFNPSWTGQVFVGGTYSDAAIALDGKRHLYAGGVDVEYKWPNGASIGARYTHENGNDHIGHGLKLRVGKKF